VIGLKGNTEAISKSAADDSVPAEAPKPPRTIDDKLRRLEEAADLLEAGTREAPGNAELHGMLGEVYLQAGRKDRAVASFQQSLRLLPDQPELRSKLQSLGGGSPSPSESPVPAGEKEAP